MTWEGLAWLVGTFKQIRAASHTFPKEAENVAETTRLVKERTTQFW